MFRAWVRHFSLQNCKLGFFGSLLPYRITYHIRINPVLVLLFSDFENLLFLVERQIFVLFWLYLNAIFESLMALWMFKMPRNLTSRNLELFWDLSFQNIPLEFIYDNYNQRKETGNYMQYSKIYVPNFSPTFCIYLLENGQMTKIRHKKPYN